jgi:(R,R)-butanediol dehydrogenase/meso-butanediol dehydrogenase/diacetyl reductase
MKAARWHARRDVRIEEVPEPPAPPVGMVQVEVSYCGLCGSDVHEYAGGPLFLPTQPHPLTGVQTPVILGHEIMANVLKIAPGETRLGIGERVAISPMVGCGECAWCMSDQIGLCTKAAVVGFSWSGGGYSRLINVHNHQCFVVPDQVSDEMGTMVGPVAEATRALKRANLQAGESLAVVGTGPIGLFVVQVGKAMGAAQIIAVDPVGRRRELALQTGATDVINPQDHQSVAIMKEKTAGKGADVVVECAGFPGTGMLAVRMARTRGRVAIVGIFEKPDVIDYFDLVNGEKTLVGSVTGYGGFEEAIKMMANGQVDIKPLITGKIRLDELPATLEMLSSSKGEHIKILVSPS